MKNNLLLILLVLLPCLAIGQNKPLNKFYRQNKREEGVRNAKLPGWLIRLGGTMGVLIGLPLLDTDRGRVGLFDVAFTFGPLLEFRPVKNWSLELAARVLVGEQVFQFKSNFIDAPSWSKVADVRGAAEARLRYTYE